MSIFNHSDYKAYIRQRMLQMPRKGRGEVLRIAQALSVHSTLISQILNGAKDFTLEQGYGVCTHFGLTGIEADYLLTMIQIERAGTAVLKKYFRDKLKKLKQDSLQMSKRMKRDRELSEDEKARFYSDWVYSGIRLMTAIDGFSRIDALAGHFGLPLAKVSEILQFLVHSGLLTESDGNYAIEVQRTFLGGDSPFLRLHHANWRMRSIHRTSTLTAEELMFTSPVALSEVDFHKFREELADLIKRFSAMVNDSKSERLACFNVDWFFVEK
jgi:uncharacterized protein (TIGR02147 family)